MVSKRKISEEDAAAAEFEEALPQDEDDVELGAAAIIVPPDGGWGWVIVFASFMANMIVDGIIFTAGQGFQPAWIAGFPGTKEGAAAWVVSLLSGCYLLVGPIASSLVNIFGCRRVCIAGTLLAFLGFLLSCFAPSIIFLYVTFGVMGGVGFGFIFLPSVVIVSYYFERRRATATGISLCGSGIGTFVFAPFLKYLLDTYPRWEQSMLIITGITLNCILCGALYRRLTPSRSQIRTLEAKLKAIDEEQETMMMSDEMLAAAAGTTSTKSNTLNGSTTAGNKTAAAAAEEPIAEEMPSNEVGHLLAANVAFERFTSDSPRGRAAPVVQQQPQQHQHQHPDSTTLSAAGSRGSSLRKRTVSNRSFRSLFEVNSVGLSPPSTSIGGGGGGGGRTRGISVTINEYRPDHAAASGADPSGGGTLSPTPYRHMTRDGVTVLNRPLSRQDIFYPGSVKNLPEFKLQPDVPHYIASTLSIHTLMGGDGGGGAGHVMPIGVKETIKATLRSMLDTSLLREPSFLVLAFSGFFTLTGFFVPFIYLPRQAMAVGHSEASSTFLVSLLGITNIVARILCGWLSDRPQVNALMLNNVALILAGVATILLPHMQPYWMLCIYCVVFGTGTACFASLRSIICVELLGLENLTNAFGLLLLFMGVASLIGSPIAGMLYDMTGSFNSSFYVMGSLITLSGAMGVPLYVSSCMNRRRELKYALNSVPPDIFVEFSDLTPTSRVQIPEQVPEVDEESTNT